MPVQGDTPQKVSVGGGFIGTPHLPPGKLRKLSLKLALGSITEVDASALVVGHFKGVPPQNAELAIDQAIGFIIKDLDNRRMIRGDLGELFFIPTHRTKLYASTVVLIGLGEFSNFTQSSLQLVGMNLIKGLIDIKAYDFGMVLVGSGDGNLSPEEAFQSMMYGLYEGLQRHDPSGKIREMILVEMNREKYKKIREVIQNFLRGDPLARKLDISFSTYELPEIKAESLKERTRVLPLNLIVQRVDTTLVFSALGESAALRKEQVISEKVLRGIVQKIEESYGKERAEEIQKTQGKLLFNQVVPEDIQKALFANKNRALLLALDAYAATIPWELMYIEHPDCDYTGFLGLIFPMGRQLMLDTSVTRWLARRKLGRKLDILLIGDPTGDLPGAVAEVEELSKILKSLGEIRVTTRTGPGENDVIEILGEIGSGKYDIVHYAGHAYFNDRNPLESGWIFKDGAKLRARDIVTLSNLPALIFSNACEAGIIERGIQPYKDKYGFAEALLRAGLINYIGTFWEIVDGPGAFFAGKFYENLLMERFIGESLIKARRDILRKYGYKELIWGSYMLYGNPTFRFKMR